MKKIALLALLSPISLLGCQSTGSLSANTTPSQQLQQSKKAKAELASVIKKQLYRSFDYQINIKMSNAVRRQALAHATPEQLASADKKNNYCIHHHDLSYIELLKQAEEIDTQISNDRYTKQRQTIQDTYLRCQKKVDDWQDENGYYEDIDYLPDYDTEHTKKDVKDAKLINAYFYQPLDVTIQGRYKPLTGQLAVMPSFSYKVRNLSIATQLPMYIDLKQMNLYVWADNFAALNSQFVDENLGTKWKNKWLKISLNSTDSNKKNGLPEGFVKSVLTSYVSAQKQAYQKEPVTDFNYINGNQLQKLVPYLENKKYQHMSKSDSIISRTQSEYEHRRQEYLINKAFLENLEKEYPKFLEEIENGKFLTLMQDNKFAQLGLQYWLSTVKKTVSTYEEEFTDEAGEMISADNKASTDINSKQFYGIDNNKLSWTYQRTEPEISNNKESKDLSVAVFTTFDKIGSGSHPFTNLPVSAKEPNANNSVDIVEYYEHLKNHYQAGKGTVVGKTLYSIISPNDNDTSDEEPVKRAEIEIVASTEKNIKDTESADCVLISVSLDSMCDDDNISNKEDKETCQAEKKQLVDTYNSHCQ